MRTRAVLVAAGLLVMTYAAAGALAEPGLNVFGVLLFMAGVLIAHDAVWMLAVLAAGAALARLVPPRYRPVAHVAAISAAALTLVAFPLVIGAGKAADNPSVLPLPYGRNLLVVLLLVACATLPACLRRARAGRPAAGRKNSERPGESGPGSAHG
ncbi:hypothetical protein EV385_5577 [Krasilnikovia cinnamomea]|uniref:Uncharacterized protein n=1 Tax=Krasilnikovia cinnamomea TaxID=349313 RepID=A0A4V6MG72_9ACTN|nr:hypothetical protein [Krasilnikovia cinnamomea]RZU53646.1 hypothetical protein EV385_5577 [Krasilnikovia cinnamomea]